MLITGPLLITAPLLLKRQPRMSNYIIIIIIIINAIQYTRKIHNTIDKILMSHKVQSK